MHCIRLDPHQITITVEQISLEIPNNAFWDTFSHALKDLASVNKGRYLYMFTLFFSALSPAGLWLIRDVHRQSMHVAELTCDWILYLSAIPLLEGLVSKLV